MANNGFYRLARRKSPTSDSVPVRTARALVRTLLGKYAAQKTDN